MAKNELASQKEQGIEIPYERLAPETLRNVIQEFVTRDGADWGEVGGALEEKVAQVMQQLRSHKVKVVFEMKSQTANIVICR